MEFFSVKLFLIVYNINYFKNAATILINGDAIINNNIIIPIILAPIFIFFFFFLLMFYTSINIIHKIKYIYNIKEYNLMGELMIKKYNNIRSIVLPNKRTNIFVISILFLGVIAGAIFANIININDKSLVIDKISLFIDNINTNSLNSLDVLKNSISINLTYVFLIWILGMTLIGIIFNIFLLFIKSFIFGFSISAFILTYSYKGIMLSLLYLLFGQLLNVFMIMIISIYSIMFTANLLNIIFKNKPSSNKILRNYIIIFLIALITSIISSLSEAFLLPSLIKLIVKLFI